MSAYDPIADMYHLMWADWYLPAALSALEHLFFAQVPPGARVLDVCCGSGHVTSELVRRGYRVSGIDSSAALIAIAQRAMPKAEFLVADVRTLSLPGGFEGALSTFDALNHLLTIDEISAAFRNVYDALDAGGLFVFDMNGEEAYLADLRQWHVHRTEQTIGLVRGAFDFETKLATTELLWFAREEHGENWRLTESSVQERCYAEGEILAALYAAGFRDVRSRPAMEAGVEPALGFGRMFFTARR